MQRHGTRILQLVIASAFLFFTNPAVAKTVTIQGATIDIEVVSDVNDWQWNFLVTLPTLPLRTLTSFHVRGLPGDVTNTGEYEDFHTKPFRAGWSVSTDKASGGINYTHTGSAGLTVSGSHLTFSFDSDYDFSDLAGSTFDVGLDFHNDPTVIYWSPVTVPLPAAFPLLLIALGGLGFFSRRRHAGSGI